MYVWLDLELLACTCGEPTTNPDTMCRVVYHATSTIIYASTLDMHSTLVNSSRKRGESRGRVWEWCHHLLWRAAEMRIHRVVSPPRIIVSSYHHIIILYSSTQTIRPYLCWYVGALWCPWQPGSITSTRRQMAVNPGSSDHRFIYLQEKEQPRATRCPGVMCQWSLYLDIYVMLSLSSRLSGVWHVHLMIKLYCVVNDLDS